MGDDRKAMNENMENCCVVCFKNVEIYSIGECDHPVCYECSTRMRVLCEQNECPICRKTLFKVIFTHKIEPYRELEMNNRSEYYNKKYKICFINQEIQKAFYNLLDHPCPKCDSKSFYSFDALKDHVRKEHELFYCNICTASLKIFTFEKKCYNRQELALHRRKGDPDNTSHRGHPLCVYCEVRFLDREELYRHLRLKHYFCHICDADGAHEYYVDYESLYDHFRSDHYLCEEGECATNGLMAVFRSEIDLKGHITSMHSKSLGKQQAKQARTLQLEITLGPRAGRIGSSGNNNQQDFPSFATLRSHRIDETNNSNNRIEASRSVTNNQSSLRIIDANLLDQEFPSLGGTGSTSSAAAGVTLAHPNMSIRAKAFGPSNLIRSEEEFPALGSTSGGGVTSNSYDTGPNTNQNSIYNNIPVSAIFKNKLARQQARINSGGKSMIIHVSNRPNVNNNNVTNFHSNVNTTTTTKKIPNQEDFPALLGSSVGNNISSMPNININSVVSAKHRPLISDYVSVTHPPSSSKITVVQKETVTPLSSSVSTLSSKKNELANTSTSVPSLTTNDFPALGGGHRKSKHSSCSASNTSSTSKSSERKQQQDQSKNDSSESDNIHNNDNEKKNKKQSNNKNGGKKSTNNKENKQVDNNNENKVINKNVKKNILNGKNYNINNDNDDKQEKSKIDSNTNSTPSPGFDQMPLRSDNDNGKNNSSVKLPPPGFKSVTLNSVAKSPNNLTFTTSLGETYSIVPNHEYIRPPNIIKRNHQLMKHIQNVVIHQVIFEEFKYISEKFREGQYKTLPYYEHCIAALKDKFDEYFPELLALLPDINKQQELYLVHCQYIKNNKKQDKSQIKLEVCPTCKQVLIPKDKQFHMKAHTLENNFPALDGTFGGSLMNSSKNKK